jgi:hypothetical protein
MSLFKRGKPVMRHWTMSAVVCAILAVPALAAAKGPEVDLVDNKLSINADTIGLARLIRLVDLATGMKSKVPPELANRNVSVKFSGLTMANGVRKIFEGLPIDYVLIEGQGVIVTAQSQLLNGTESVPVYNSAPTQPEQAFNQDFQQQVPLNGNGLPSQAQQQPPMIQTPFGPVANPNRTPQPNQPNAALSAPGQQQNTLFPGSIQQNPTQNGIGGAPVGIQPASNPFGTVSPFGTPAQPQPQAQPQTNPNNNNLFNNPFNSNSSLQRTP